MKSGSYVPDSGDIVWLNFTPQAGHEQRGKRPALVISPKIYNEKTSLFICVPITSKIKGYPFEVAIPQDLEVKGVILSDQIKSLDYKVREATFICKLPQHTLQEVKKRIALLI